MSSKIRSKSQFMELVELGALGNVLRSWRGSRAFGRVARSLECNVGVRCLGVPGMPYVYNVRPTEALWRGEQLERVHRCTALFQEAAPEDTIVLQGEFCEAEHGAMVEWSRVRTHMRASLAQERNVLFGPGARLMLKRVMTPDSYDEMLTLGELFPGAVIEFTVFSHCIGPLKGRNHCIWEVRNY